ncbi:TPA: hypothetical protein ACM98L_003558 [Escherichia coli]
MLRNRARRLDYKITR